VRKCMAVCVIHGAGTWQEGATLPPPAPPLHVYIGTLRANGQVKTTFHNYLGIRY